MFDTTVPASSPLSVRTTPVPLGILWVFPLSANLTTILDKPRLMIGRGEGCDVRLVGSDVSRQHALLVNDAQSWSIRDLSSKNGVYVNAERSIQATLAIGDVLRIGDYVGIVRPVSWQLGEQQGSCRVLAHGLLGGALLEQVLAPVRHTAQTDLPVVIEGETGTGKECVARAIHEWSGRSGPFVGVNCAALPEPLAESELFGHKRGAFTGAERSRVGYLQSAHGGTLLLDEVTDLPVSIQPKLLRALELRQIVPLGDSNPVGVDVRLVAACQEPLQLAAQEKRFRADLYARLSGLVIRLPPLRERVEDVPGLLVHMLSRESAGPIPALDSRFVEALCLHDWPFNVRELHLLSRRLLALHGREPTLRRSHLPPEVLNGQGQPDSVDTPATNRQTVENVRQVSPRAAEFRQLTELRRHEEIEALRSALQAHGGNVARAARQVGISRQRAYRLMQGCIDPNEVRKSDRPGGTGGESD